MIKKDRQKNFVDVVYNIFIIQFWICLILSFVLEVSGVISIFGSIILFSYALFCGFTAIYLRLKVIEQYIIHLLEFMDRIINIVEKLRKNGGEEN